MNNTAVVTVCIGENFNDIGNITHPILKDYSDRIGSDFVVINNPGDLKIYQWVKFKLFDLIDQYKRIIYLDTDIIIRNDCPNLFGIVPEDCFGVFNEGKYDSRQEAINEVSKKYNEKIIDWNGNYYNTGVMIFSSIHKHIFKLPEVINELAMYEQSYINLRLINNNVKIMELPYQFNRMGFIDNIVKEDKLKSYIVHYAGRCLEHNVFLNAIREDLKSWNNSNGGING